MFPATAAHQRLACTDCGAHVLADVKLRHPGGMCGVCKSYALVPVALVTAPSRPAFSRSAWVSA
jgi:hypothetical protein